MPAEGETVAAYDRNVVPASLGLPSLSLMPDAATLVAQSDVVVVSHATEAFRAAIATRPREVHVLDLARLFRTPPRAPTYQGIAW